MGPWTNLAVASVFEIAWAISLKYSCGFTRPRASIVACVAMVGSVYFLSRALKSLPVGTAYAVWTGIGAIGTLLFGIIFLSESASLVRVLCIGAIVAGIIGIRLGYQ